MESYTRYSSLRKLVVDLTMKRYDLLAMSAMTKSNVFAKYNNVTVSLLGK